MSKSNKLRLLAKKVSKPKVSDVRPLAVRHKKYRFLIVCEGSKTEPNYFKAIINDPKYSTVIDAQLMGLGRSTVSLVKETLAIKDKIENANELALDSVWVVFDEDGNKDFNEAIIMAKQNGIKSAWSNEAFELWYYLHFEFLNTGISRHDYIDKLNEVIRKRMNNKKFQYKKNDENFYVILQEYGDENFAKRCAKNLRNLYNGLSDFRKMKPCTTVDLLVKELKHPDKYLDA